MEICKHGITFSRLLFLIYKIDLNRPFIHRIHKVGISNTILNNDNVKAQSLFKRAELVSRFYCIPCSISKPYNQTRLAP